MLSAYVWNFVIYKHNRIDMYAMLSWGVILEQFKDLNPSNWGKNLNHQSVNGMEGIQGVQYFPQILFKIYTRV